MVEPGLRFQVLLLMNPILLVNYTAPVFSSLLEHKSNKLDLGKAKIYPKKEILNFWVAKVNKTSSKEKAPWCLKVPGFLHPRFPPLAYLTPAQLASCLQHSLTALSHILAFVGRMTLTTWFHCFYCCWWYYTEPWFSPGFVPVNSITLYVLWGQGPCVVLSYLEMHCSGLETKWVVEFYFSSVAEFTRCWHSD